MNFNIPFYVLRRAFPVDTMWVDGIAEIIGYSRKENLHIVICDGNRTSQDGKYRVQKYRPKDPKHHFENWNKWKYPFKYLVDENYAEHVSEEVIDFSKL
jgi:hypothetical protein